MRRAKRPLLPPLPVFKPPPVGTREYCLLGFREDTPDINHQLERALVFCHTDPLTDYGYRMDQGHITRSRRRERMRHARERGRHTEVEWIRLLIRFHFCCLCCGSTCDDDWWNLTKDHIIPISRGGSDAIDNLQPLCHACNVAKSDKTIDYRLRATCPMTSPIVQSATVSW